MQRNVLGGPPSGLFFFLSFATFCLFLGGGGAFRTDVLAPPFVTMQDQSGLSFHLGTDAIFAFSNSHLDRASLFEPYICVITAEWVEIDAEEYQS